jgi:hypothetical protein
MRTFLTFLAAVCVVGFLAALSTRADDTKGQQTTITGILIDQACGAKMMTQDDPEKAAAAHPKSCAIKDACAASGYAVISGKDMIKFDDNGNSLAKDFLAKTDKEDDLRVTVQGTQDGDKIAVTSLTAAPDKN